jgi:nitroreductase
MELYEAMRTTFACREFTGEAIPGEVLQRIIDNARFAPSGGNRQGWRIINVVDPDKKEQLADLSLAAATRYVLEGHHNHHGRGQRSASTGTVGHSIALGSGGRHSPGQTVKATDQVKAQTSGRDPVYRQLGWVESGKHRTRLASRTKRVAAKSIAAIPAESIPFIGVAVLIADTGYELYAACETVTDLDQLYKDLGMADETPDDVMHSVCDPELPDAGEVWEAMSE